MEPVGRGHPPQFSSIQRPKITPDQLKDAAAKLINRSVDATKDRRQKDGAPALYIKQDIFRTFTVALPLDQTHLRPQIPPTDKIDR